jgi:predicted nicotinamide N-methyase
MAKITYKSDPEAYAMAVKAILDDLVTSLKEANTTYGTQAGYAALSYAVAVQMANVIAENPENTCGHALLLDFIQALMQMALGPVPEVKARGDQPKPRYLT